MTESPQTPQTPPGWYDDGRGAMRWWDGAAWTEHVAAPPAPTAPSAPGAWPGYGAAMPVPAPKRSLTWLWVALGVVGLVVVAGIVSVIVVVARHSSRHEVPAAERVARHFMSSSDQASASQDLARSFAANSRGLCDATQTGRLGVSGVRYRIADSRHTVDGAVVDVDIINAAGLSLTLTLTDDDGWKITTMACHGGE